MNRENKAVCCELEAGKSLGTPLAPIEQTAEDAGRVCFARAARRGH